MSVDLFIFDVDGTLCDRDARALRPGTFTKLAIMANTYPNAQFAIASNQGGVGLRRWMEMGDFGAPELYPTQDEVEERLIDIARHVEIATRRRCRTYVSFAYITRAGKLAPKPPDVDETDERWFYAFRKPNTGMIEAAIRDAGVADGNILMIGDRQEDHDAAQGAGISFAWAAIFFAE